MFQSTPGNMPPEHETPQERTKRMLAEERRKFSEHEKASRANEGKPQFPLKIKLQTALPLVALVASLYTFSFYYMRIRKKQFLDRQEGNQILKDVRDIDAPEPPIEFPDDPEFIIEDENRRW